jgi:DNA-binding GntR family transcriptional regulator
MLVLHAMYWSQAAYRSASCAAAVTMRRLAPLARQLGVSRTPLCIALGELEKEGLLERLPTRGFKRREFPMEQVANAIDVRGVLEGMAARNPALTSALEHNERIPMTAAATITFNSAVQELAYPLIRRAHKESCDGTTHAQLHQPAG